MECFTNTLTQAGLKLRDEKLAKQELLELRRKYEPYVYSLSKYLHIKSPPWIPAPSATDNWQTSAWGRSKGFQIEDLLGEEHDEHF
jgi:hypothetical protein